LGGPALVAGFEYDAVGRMTRVLEAGEQIAAYGYDLLSRRTSLLYANLTGANWAWRLNDVLGGVVHGFASGAGVTFGYRRNRENAVSARTVSDAAYLPGPTNPALALGTRAYAANAMNQYTNVAGTTYSDDSDGNHTGDGVWSYGHDAQGRLVSATRPGTSISLGYDAVGRRRSRAVNGMATAFLSAGDQEVAEYDGAGALLRRFVWGPAGPDDIIAVIGVTGSVAARRRFHHADGLGSTAALTDAAGVVLERYAYTPFGVSESNTGGTPWRFTGRRLDGETGLYHLRARDYAPLIGRFVQPDPIGRAGGINLYAYVGNDALNATDPSGLYVQYVAGAAFGIASDFAFNANEYRQLSGWGVGARIAIAAASGAFGVRVTQFIVGRGSRLAVLQNGAGGAALELAAGGAGASAGNAAQQLAQRGAGVRSEPFSFAEMMIAGGLGLIASTPGAGLRGAGLQGSSSGPRSAGGIATEVTNEARAALFTSPSGEVAKRLGLDGASGRTLDPGPGFDSELSSGLYIGRAAFNKPK